MSRTIPLAGAGALLLGLALPAAHAGAPQLRTQAPGFYRMVLGSYEITVLSDGTHPFPVGSVMTGTSPAAIAGALARDELHLPLQGSINAFLVNTGDKLVLIDSGAGALYGDCCGKLLANLRAAGYEPGQVDEVLLTHLHKDHVGGIEHDGKAVFPNAMVRAAAPEAGYWLTPGNEAKAPALLTSFFGSARTAIAPYAASGRFQPFADGARLEPGIRAVPEPGHTPGHTGYLVESGGQQLLVWGDVVHVAPVQLWDTRAGVKYDSSEDAARSTRAVLLGRATSQHLWIGAAHIAFPGLGHLRRNHGHYDWIPANYEGDPLGTGN
jgi:glyoxylase-like metal-dependent hydrolase (beta-lactamase superfamily II)